jgi:hypothetical protein
MIGSTIYSESPPTGIFHFVKNIARKTVIKMKGTALGIT